MFEQNEVNEAFEILLKEIETVIKSIREKAKESLDLGDYEKAKRLIEDTERITNFMEKVKELQKEWRTLFTPTTSFISKPSETKAQQIKPGRLEPGLKTPDYAYVLPILESLVELGGRAETKVVLERVKQKMKNILNEYDMQPLSSGEERWRNTARWIRQRMVYAGLLSKNSPIGVWEITEKGREVLKRLKEESDRDTLSNNPQ